MNKYKYFPPPSPPLHLYYYYLLKYKIIDTYIYRERESRERMVVLVYGAGNAACPQRVMVCLVELDLQFQLIPIDIQSGQQKTPHFRQRQPFGQVPAIEDGDFKLFESRAIIRYYASKCATNGGINLYGETIEERALVDQWLEVESHNYNPPIYTMVLQLMVLPSSGHKTDFELVQDCKDKLEKVLDVYEERLSESKYLAGDKFSLADLSHLPNTKFLMGQGGMADSIRRRKNVCAWWEDISGRPSWKKVLAEFAG
ncbi:glutathione S-transferase F12-like [Andrographis paniculata]|uniref:glutathione S-transferase F12-like n=1 Tax=Andrographis paniculata TaxID=175694 RepID=UPI0021E930AC|nr:glutathione S-transferase F12-like [Andrographis paniculata]